jgi:hypothetical protein
MFSRRQAIDDELVYPKSTLEEYFRLLMMMLTMMMMISSSSSSNVSKFVREISLEILISTRFLSVVLLPWLLPY